MKKYIAFVLSFIMLFALCACGETEELTEEVQEQPAATEEVQEPEAEAQAEEQPKELAEIEITTENFLEYFEQRMTIDYDGAEKDADGNYINLVVHYDYVLKDGIQAAYERAGECSVVADFDVEYAQTLNPSEVDFDALSCGEGESSDSVAFVTSINADWWNPDGTICESGGEYENAEYKMTVLSMDFYISNDNGTYVNTLEYFELTGASGIIFIYQ